MILGGGRLDITTAQSRIPCDMRSCEGVRPFTAPPFMCFASQTIPVRFSVRDSERDFIFPWAHTRAAHFSYDAQENEPENGNRRRLRRKRGFSHYRFPTAGARRSWILEVSYCYTSSGSPCGRGVKHPGFPGCHDRIFPFADGLSILRPWRESVIVRWRCDRSGPFLSLVHGSWQHG